MYIGDYRLADTLYFSFTTRRFTTGAPFTLAGTPAVSVYKDADDTQTTTGVTLAVDDDGITGWNRVTIDLSDAFYTTATDFQVVITTGTVDSVSVVGEVVAHFSIENRSALMPTTAGHKVTLNGSGKVSGVVLTDTVTTYTGNTVQTGDSFARIGATGSGLTSLASQASVNTIDDFLDTEMAAALVAILAALALLDDPRGEPGQGAPPVSADLVTKVDYLYKAFRNKQTQTASEWKLFADDAATVDQKSAVSDDGVTFTRDEVATGP